MREFRVENKKLRNICDLDQLDFKTTSEVDILEGIIGQERAVNAMDFGLKINNKGYNIYMAGLNGTGKTSYANSLAHKIAVAGEVPNDICYVYNYKEPDRPLIIEVSSGLGESFAKDMDNLVDIIKKEIPKAFVGEEFDTQRRMIRDKYQKDTSELLQELDKIGKEKDFIVRQSGKGLVSVPLVNGKPIDQMDEELITDEITREIQNKLPEMQKLLDEVTRKIKLLEKEASSELASIEKKVAMAVIKPEIALVREAYNAHSKILSYLDNVEKDMVDNQVFKVKEEDQSLNPLLPQLQLENNLIRYKVNLFVNNAKQKGAPVVCETNPNYYNLFGKIEGKANFGGISTDFTMIKCGSIHKANGGYLIIHANEILKDPFAWGALKRTLKGQESIIENIGEQFKIMPTATIKPEAMPIKVKVILIGSSHIQQLLYSYDEDFSKLFKIRANFDTSMERNPDNILMYSQFISAVCKQENLKAFDKSAVARVIEFSSRLADHQKKLSTKFNETVEIVYEANAWAEIENNEYVTAYHVEKAINEKINRANLLEEKIQENMIEGQILIETHGSTIGQINGLSVYSLGDYSFGKPSRITARAFKGKKGLINIDREVKMSGKIYDKGVLILAGYIGGKFARNTPLSITASICFEQNYSGIDGDSASCAELVVLLSAIVDIPVRQDIAITGSMNQRGQVQPIGGVNQKIEGFYGLCKERGLTKTQGVIIPKQNIDNLMLNNEVVEDCKAGNFHIYAISDVEEAIEILTETAPHEFFKMVQKKLEKMAEKEEIEGTLD